MLSLAEIDTDASANGGTIQVDIDGDAGDCSGESRPLRPTSAAVTDATPAGTRAGGALGRSIAATVPQGVELDDRVGNVRECAPVLPNRNRTQDRRLVIIDHLYLYNYDNPNCLIRPPL